MDLRPKGPIFGLTLKGMLVITALLAVGMAFVGTKVRRARDEDAIAREIVRLGGTVQRDYFGMAATNAGMERTWFERLIDLDLEVHISNVDLRGTDVSDELVARLAALEDLRSIDVSDTRIEGTGFAALAGLPKLDRVQLWNSRVTDEGLVSICALPNIENLSINYGPWRPRGSLPPPRITNAGLAQIGSLRSLKQLELGEDQITDATLRALTFSIRVERLALSDAQISDEGLAALVDAAPGLRTLSILRCPISGRGLASLRACPQLTTLQINNCPVTDDGLASIVQLQQLQRLWMKGNTKLTDEALRHIGELGGLTELDINGASFSDAGLKRLSRLDSLTHLALSLSRGAFTDAALEQLPGLKKLTWVNLNRNAFSAEAKEKLQKTVPGIIIAP